MFRVVIADDEKFIVQLIRALIDDERLGVEIVGEAGDGTQALELVKAERPDILITDIRMPSMDGLELIEQIRQSGILVSVIAISGHRRFDYAYSAIKYGVEDFIVKPINEKDLNDALEKVCARLRGERSASEHMRDLAERAAQDVSTLRARFLEDLLSGALPANEPLHELNRRYRTHFQEGEFTGLAVWLDIPGACGAYSPILEKSLKTLRREMAACCNDVECAYIGGVICALLGTRGAKTQDLLVKVKKLFESLLIELDAYNGIGVSIGLGPHARALSDAARSVRLARACVRAKCVLGPQRIYLSERLDMEHMDVELCAADARRLAILMESHSADQVRPWVEALFGETDAHYREHPIEAVATADAAVRRFQGLCERLGIQADAEGERQRLHALDAARSLPELKRALAAYVEWVLRADYATRAERKAVPVMRAKAFIAEKLGEPIKLEDIAQAAALSPSYLSVLFKKETGETVSDYLLRLRLEEAKRLLKTTGLNLNEIAERVGYADAKHFSKMFRKQTGARPLEYRKLYAW